LSISAALDGRGPWRRGPVPVLTFHVSYIDRGFTRGKRSVIAMKCKIAARKTSFAIVPQCCFWMSVQRKWESRTYTHIQRFAMYSYALLQDCLSLKPNAKDKDEVTVPFKGQLLAKASFFVAVGNQITARSPGTIPEACGHLRDTAY
jgi:hypothetical protein